MKKLFSVLILVLFSVFVYAQSSYKYDYQSGNSYNIHKDSSGTTTQGYNLKTGSTWQQRNNSNGTYSGTDSKGGYYTGDNKTGYYHNSRTGKTCYGKGAARTCY